MKNLTPHQEQLVNDMIAEFLRINPKPADGGKKRFSLATIDECNQEKDNFLKSLAVYNRSFLDDAIKKMQRQLDEFIEEFGQVVGIAEGSGSSLQCSRTSNLYKSGHSSPNSDLSPYYVQVTLFPKHFGTIVNNASRIASSSMFSFYAGIRSKIEKMVCTNGEEVRSAKYEAIWWGPDSYPCNGNQGGWITTRESLEDFLQSSGRLQQAIVSISNNKPNNK